jgi:hypothetical protein
VIVGFCTIGEFNSKQWQKTPSHKRRKWREADEEEDGEKSHVPMSPTSSSSSASTSSSSSSSTADSNPTSSAAEEDMLEFEVISGGGRG